MEEVIKRKLKIYWIPFIVSIGCALYNFPGVSDGNSVRIFAAGVCFICALY